MLAEFDAFQTSCGLRFFNVSALVQETPQCKERPAPLISCNYANSRPSCFLVKSTVNIDLDGSAIWGVHLRSWQIEADSSQRGFLQEQFLLPSDVSRRIPLSDLEQCRNIFR
jgi:hypothetical protein